MLLRHTTAWLRRRQLTPAHAAAAGVLPVVAACLARWALNPVLSAGYPYLTFFPALIVAGALGGWAGGLIALGLSVPATWYFFVAPAGTFGVKSTADAISLAVFVVSGGMIVAVAALLRVAADRLAEQEAQAQAAARRLEESFATQSLLMSEVNHRARNLLAVAQAVVRLTPRDDMDRYVSSLTGRIEALAHAHGLLSDEGWSGALLTDIVEAELRPFATAGADQVTMEGPPVRLRAETVQPLVLVFHELTTNAAKYGGLSTPSGRVSIRWRRDEDGGILVDWEEAGGPPPRKPTRSGFGTKLITTTLASSHGGTFTQDWGPGGMACALRLPAEMAET